MKKVIKWIGIVLLLILILSVSVAYFLIKKADKMMSLKFDIDPPVFSIPADSQSIAKGERLANLCKDCHGMNFEGKAFFDAPEIGKVYAPNLTRGKGSAISYYTDRDWIQAVRHGVRPNGDGLMIMPSKDYFHMSKEDISNLIAYIKNVKALDHETGNNKMTKMGKILLALGAFGDIHSAAQIDHKKEAGEAPAMAETKEYGEYVVMISGCRSCHNKDLNGGKHPDPASPPVPNLTPRGNLTKWSNEQFINCMRYGKTPEGKIFRLQKHLNSVL